MRYSDRPTHFTNEIHEGYYHNEKTAHIISNIVLYIFIILVATTFATMIWGLLIGAEDMVETIGEWVYQIMN